MKRYVVAVGLLLAALVGCTSEGVAPVAVGPATTVSTSTTSSTSSTSSSTSTPPTSAVASSSPEPTTESSPPPLEMSTIEPTPTPTATGEPISAQEAADRAAIEAAWRSFWDVYAKIDTIPSAERSAALDPFAVEPVLGDVLAEAEQLAAEGKIGFGSVVLNPYWQEPIGGADTASLGDCQDASNFGSKDIVTGEITSFGIKNHNTVGSFVRMRDGVWKLSQIYYFPNECTPSQ